MAMLGMRFKYLMAITFSTAMVFITLTLFPAPTSTEAQISVKLEYKHKPATALKYLMLTDMTATVSGTNLSMKSSMPFKQEIKSVDQQGNMELLISTQKVSIETDQNWQALFGSDPMLAEGELEKMQITMKMAKSGKILDFQIPGGKKMEAGVKETFSRVIPNFPSRPLRVNDTWKSELSAIPKEFAMGSETSQQKAEVIYKLIGFEKYKTYDCAKISMTSNVNAQGSISPTGAPIPMVFKGTSTGILLFAHGPGFIVKQDMQIDLTISVNMAGMPPLELLSKSSMRTELQN